MRDGRTKILFAVLMLCVLGGCGNENMISDSDFQPILNENGREEVRLCASTFSVTMQEVVADYNNQSDRYEIVLVEFDNKTSPDDQRTRIQLELTNGGGPDLLTSTALQRIDMKPYAEAGVFLDVTDFLTEQGDIVSNVAEANRVNGRLYGVPYSFSLGTMVTSPQMATDIENWTKDYCMQTAQDREVSLFIKAPYGWTKEKAGLYVLNVLGVGMGGIQLFVDEEQGISSFEQSEFIEMLEFAKRYSDPEPEKQDSGRLASGEQFCTALFINDFNSFSYCRELFEGSPVYMGYPSPQGGVYELWVQSIYINAASDRKEGAKDFLHYLLSDETQRKLVIGNGNFPVKQSFLETLWKEAQKEVLDENTGYERGDIFLKPDLMTQEDESIFWEMLEHSIYYQWQNDIWDIIEEEAFPFFYGEKQAEDVANAIDSRVQLYLNERN
ncbi:MAG: extracellular solute-binding protein [Acetatifactor sp.]|nr:extracellular solute-binding protein [Acetatifactor sp.]